MKDTLNWIRIIEIAVLVSFGGFTVYVNAQRVPGIEAKVQGLDVRQSVTEAHYVDILKSLERIERRIK